MEIESTVLVREWYRNNKLHREDGPAIECANGDKYWYLNGVELTYMEFLNRTKPKECLKESNGNN